MKTIAALIAATAATLITGSALAADSSDRTSMPNNCSDRDANCVIQDGPARGRRGIDTSTTTLPSGAIGDNKGDNKGGSAGSKGGESRSGGGSSR